MFPWVNHLRLFKCNGIFFNIKSIQHSDSNIVRTVFWSPLKLTLSFIVSFDELLIVKQVKLMKKTEPYPVRFYFFFFLYITNDVFFCLSRFLISFVSPSAFKLLSFRRHCVLYETAYHVSYQEVHSDDAIKTEGLVVFIYTNLSK